MENKPAEVTPDPSYWKARGEATRGSVYFKSPDPKPQPKESLQMYEFPGEK